jgi:hypothetical protein
MVSAIARKMEVGVGFAAELAELKRDVEPGAVLDEIEEVTKGLEKR